MNVKTQVLANQNENSAVKAGFPGFDHIYGNPPYLRNCHLEILSRVIKLLRKSGLMTAIHPNRWMLDPFDDLRIRKTAKQKYIDLYRSCSSAEQVTREAAVALFNTPLEYELGINTFIAGYDNKNATVGLGTVMAGAINKVLKKCGYEV